MTEPGRDRHLLPRAEFVQSLERGLAVIRAFSAERSALTLNEVAEVTGLSRATVRRFLLTLESLGYVAREQRQFSLRPRVLELGYAYLSSISVAEIAQDRLEGLATELHESCSASVLDAPDIVYIARAATSRIMSITLAVGSRLPAYATSMGRNLLAHQEPSVIDEYFRTAELKQLTSRTEVGEVTLRRILDTVREQGWAVIDQELEDGVRSVAVPIHGKGDRVIAAINASAHAGRVSLKTLTTRFLSLLQEAARDIDTELGARVVDWRAQ